MNATITRRRSLCMALPVLLPLTSLAPLARAHGEKAHGSPAPVIREQKPWGIGAAPQEATRTIDIIMTDDMRFTPSHIDVREGETLRLRAINQGKVLHEIVLGTLPELQAHAEMMRRHPNMAHDEPYMAHVPHGRRGEITWTFNRPGDFEFACLIPGHFDAGMRGTIRVAPKNKP